MADKQEPKQYYYCHPESECIWISENPNEAIELVEEITLQEFDNLDAMGWKIHRD